MTYTQLRTSRFNIDRRLARLTKWTSFPLKAARNQSFAFISFIAFSATAFAGPHGQHMLDRLDTDEDGMISLEEFQARDRGLIHRIDSDGDNAVTREEIDAHLTAAFAERESEMAERRSAIAERIEERFAAGDMDGDGILTSEEAKMAAFTRIDENADGYLSEDEVSNVAAHRDRNKRGHFGRRGADRSRDI